MPWLKAVEVLVVLGAGAAFVWWQWRDVTRAQAQSRREREAREARESPGASDTPRPTQARGDADGKERGVRSGGTAAASGLDRSSASSERPS